MKTLSRLDKSSVGFSDLLNIFEFCKMSGLSRNICDVVN